VDGRGTAGGDDTEVTRVRGRGGGGLGWRSIVAGRVWWRSRSVALSSSESTNHKTCESESVLHGDGGIGSVANVLNRWNRYNEATDSC
jgi:hypothetical protein